MEKSPEAPPLEFFPEDDPEVVETLGNAAEGEYKRLIARLKAEAKEGAKE